MYQNRRSGRDFSTQTNGLQSDGRYRWLNQKKYKVDLVQTDQHSNRLESTVTLTVAQNLTKLLGSNLSSRAFYFVSNAVISDTDNHNLNGIEEKSFVDSDQPSESSFRGSFSDDNCNAVQKNESVIGSPLKLQEIANLAPLSLSSPLFRGEKLSKAKGLDLSTQIPIQDARLVMQKFLKNEKQNSEGPALAVLCNAQDVRKTLMIGVCKNLKKEPTEEDQVTNTLFSLTMEKVQLSCLGEPSFRKCAGQKCQMESTYDLLDTSLGLGSIKLRATWEDMKGSLKINKPLSTEFSLEWDLATGNQLSPVFAVYRELQKLSSFLRVLRNESDIEQVFPKSEDAVSTNATKKLREFFARKKDDDLVSKSTPCLLDPGNNRLNLNLALDRDFTDELWDVLSSCSNFKEMVSCLRETFDEMRRGQMHVFVTTDNRSTMANLSRAAASGLAVFPPLGDRQLALRLVTEIGLEKLRKLYLTIMVTTNKLCSPAQWEKLFSQETSASSYVQQGEEGCGEITVLSKQFSVLEQLHDCLECVAIMGTFTDSIDLTKVANVVLAGGDSCKVNPALAWGEIEKRQWTSLRRKTVSNAVSTVETFIHSMPEGILDTPCESECVWRLTAQQNIL
ncbi:zwilch-like protein [Elysia marginata]|uniref:Protein zwilch n=1 Tax=Elysia marginata TaxID=1093978 RepID=A0AAV4JKF4_9GAST|nr:zwilch-like protein [Elysia marginata]